MGKEVEEKKPFREKFLELWDERNGSEIGKMLGSGFLGQKGDNGISPGVGASVGLEGQII